MHVLRQTNSYALHSRNRWNFGDMTKDTLANLEKIEVEIW
jgi:hypothetical protein